MMEEPDDLEVYFKKSDLLLREIRVTLERKALVAASEGDFERCKAALECYVLVSQANSA